MINNVLKKCPICKNELEISKLRCASCDMEYSGSFHIPLLSNLDEEDVEFIINFLKNEGNISKLQNESGKTYASIKNSLNTINIKLGSIKEKKEKKLKDLAEAELEEDSEEAQK